MKKKIALVANTGWYIYNFRMNIVKKLINEKKYEVYVITPKDKYIEKIKNQFPSIVYLPLQKLNRSSKNLLNDISLLVELINIYKSNKLDLAIHYTIKPNIYGSIAAKMAHVKSIAIVTGLGYTYIHNGWINFLSNILYKFAFKFPQRIIFENIDDRLLFIEKKITSASKSISIKGCGVNTEYFFLNGLNQKPSPQIVFTFIGRLLYDKGINEFIEAAKGVYSKNQNTEFWIVGGLDNANPASISQNEINSWLSSKFIKYFGEVEDVRPFISKSDCIVLPSYREGLPKVLLESMSMGKPVIATDVPGCKEAVEDFKNGVLVQKMDCKSLERIILEFASFSKEKMQEMGEYGRQKVLKEFDERKIADLIYQEIVQLI